MLVAMATSVEGSTTILKSIMYSHKSTNPTNLANIGLVDVEIIGLTGIVKNK